MSAAFEEAWIFLKAAFQPVEGDFLGSGANQYVYEQAGNPDVVKVGGLSTVPELYFNELLKPTKMFAGQSLIPMTEELPMEAQARFAGRIPVLSTQIRGTPFPDTGNYKRNISDSFKNMIQAYDHPRYGPLLEALGVADLKKPNFMTVAGYDYPVIHDPAFYGPDNPRSERSPEYGAAYAARGTPRRLGIDYTIPDRLREAFARRVDELPFDEYVEPLYQSEAPVNTDLESELMNQALNIDSILGKIGVRNRL